MTNELWTWLMNLPRMFAEFGNWLVTPLEHINLAPLAIFTITGITALVSFKLIRLVIGG